MTRPPSRQILGISFVLLSALALSAQNVVLRLFFAQSQVFGRISFGGFVTPQLSHILLLLALRMATMAVLLTILAPRLYPKTFAVLRALPQTPQLWKTVTASGVCLFLGLTLLYAALSQVATGIAISLFFIYPAITFLLAWRWFKQPPRAYQLGLMVVIFIGVGLTSFTFASGTSASGTAASGSASNPVLGSLCALGAGLNFGLYGIVAELSLQPQKGHSGLHPVPFSLYTFTTVALLAALTLGANPQISIAPAGWSPVLAMTGVSALLTLVAYVLNNVGISQIGASLTALLTASTPVLTTMFAWWILQETLQTRQAVGIGLVTLGITLLSIKARRET
ncbi:MAG: DMT family transporter [Cyanobacteria bacterium P01_A01_bin.105]